jgi:hypothetical protein
MPRYHSTTVHLLVSGSEMDRHILYGRAQIPPTDRLGGTPSEKLEHAARGTD